MVVPANLHPYLSDRSYLAPLAPEFDQVYNLLVDRFKTFPCLPQPERAVPEYDSSGCLCPDGCHRLSYPGILPGALVCLPRHCQPGQTLSREISANLMIIPVFTFSLAHWNCFFPYENTVNSFKKDFSKYEENLVIIITQSSLGFMLHEQIL